MEGRSTEGFPPDEGRSEKVAALSLGVFWVSGPHLGLHSGGSQGSGGGGGEIALADVPLHFRLPLSLWLHHFLQHLLLPFLWLFLLVGVNWARKKVGSVL